MRDQVIFIDNYTRELAFKSLLNVMVVETAYAFTDQQPKREDSIFNAELSDIAGYPPTVEGQATFLTDLMNTVKKVNEQGNRGLGIVYQHPDRRLPHQGTGRV